MPKRALVTGVTGQDGAYLSRLLLEKGYEVYGAFRRSASTNLWRLAELGIEDEVRMVPFDLLEFTNILRTIEKVQPDEVYNLAAQSFVALSFEQPLFTADADALGVARLLEVIRTVDPKIRFYQASTSEMFGRARQVPQDEATPFYPRSPYGVAKLYGHWMTVNYREGHDLFAVSGILFNHESPLRGLEFVTRKITSAMARIHQGQQDLLALGNLNAARDWGFAGDYVQAMWLMLQQDSAEDYVISTGESHTVREFAALAAATAGFDLEWRGEGQEEKGVDRRTGRTIVEVNPDYYRPSEVDVLLGRSDRARQQLGWAPTVAFETLVERMTRADIDRAARGGILV
jgi:GDPmannose 4,6-dehydratase